MNRPSGTSGSACRSGGGCGRRRRNRHRNRARSRRGRARGGTITQFDFLPVTVGFDTLLARGELLITAQSYDGRPAPPGGGQPGPARRPGRISMPWA